MEKEKRKCKPRRRWKIIGVFANILSLIACVWTTNYFFFGHSLSYFSRFETPEEVVAFLHEHFDLNVTTSEEILTFMDAYPLEYDGCWDVTPTPNHFANQVVDENVTNIIRCSVPTWFGFPGTSYYSMSFYISKNDTLVYIGASWSCACL